MLKRVFAAILVVGLAAGCVDKDGIYANPPQALITQIEHLLPAAEKFVVKNESEAIADAPGESHRIMSRTLFPFLPNFAQTLTCI